MDPTDTTATLWPLALFMALVPLAMAAILALSSLLGQRGSGREPARDEPYESGIVPTGTVRMHFDAKFYLMAMFFAIFDLEAVFVYAYAVAFSELGWRGYVEAVTFIGVLGASLFYLWRLGALDWGSRRRPQGKAGEP